MTDKQNKAFKIFKEILEKEQREYNLVNTYTQFLYDNRKEILELIEEQQKEIEEKDNELHILHHILDNDYISKEKIRDRLRLFQDNSLSYMNLVLFQSIMELLGE